MSKVKVGDRVRVVVEGTVQNITLNEHVQVCGVYYYFDENYKVGLVSIEVIEPPFVLPNKKWAQVVDSQNLLWTRVHPEDELSIHYQWVSVGGKIIPSWKLLKLSGLRVISEGVDDE
jgi:hypothetical protein